MASPASPQQRAGTSDQEIETVPACGIIMPISATANHTEQHWADVQKLLHRTLNSAGYKAENVWVDDLRDRVSERIIGNIFRHEIVVADITDLNPNVMLELGLRLSSRKPTVVISSSQNNIPFDIRDFHILMYPPDLNILEMEVFFRRLIEIVQKQTDAVKRGDYNPFLTGVVIDVLEPTTKSGPIEDIVLSRLDDLGVRFSRLERRVDAGNPGTIPSIGSDTVLAVVRGLSETDLRELELAIDSSPDLVCYPRSKPDGTAEIRIEAVSSVSGGNLVERVQSILVNRGVEEFTVSVGVPRNVRPLRRVRE